MIRVLLAIVFLAMCTGAWAQSPLDGLSLHRNFSAMRESSTDPNWEHGNNDKRSIPPSETLILADLQGPGKIAHIWCTIKSNEKYYGKLLVLRMYWDGEKNPSVEVPLNDFFCQGHGLDLQVDSFPIRVTSDGRARNCYWPMPFRKSAKITVTNEGTQPVLSFYYYVDWQKHKSLPENEAYFHAHYRQQYPCVKGEDYLILDAEGRGHYVGCNLSVRNRKPGWWGEGDDRFYIDGEKEPSLKGTGSEDYFCDAWGIRKLDGLYYGFPIAEGRETLQRSTNYRFHIQDPVPFTKSLKMTMEHECVKPDGSKWERADDWSSVAYWYQSEPHKPFPPLPAPADRLYDKDAVVIEGESLIDSSHTSGPKPTEQKHSRWSDGKQLFFKPTDVPASVTVRLEVPQAGKYTVTAGITKASDYGTYQTYMDGEPIGQALDLYSEAVVQWETTFGVKELASGLHELKFETNSKNAASKGCYFGLDVIKLIPL